jgi:hypothetical protein
VKTAETLQVKRYPPPKTDRNGSAEHRGPDRRRALIYWRDAIADNFPAAGDVLGAEERTGNKSELARRWQ